MFKKEKGITLVALVITIIVLLILAGVTIAMVVGDNGILTRSRQSNFANQEGKIQENVELAIADLSAEIAVDVDENGFDGFTQTELETILKKSLGDSLEVGHEEKTNGLTDGKYYFELPSDETENGFDSETTGTITIYYTDAKLKNSAYKGWNGPLKYTVPVKAGYQLGTVDTSATENDGNYNNTDAE